MPASSRGDQMCPDDHNHGVDTVCYLHHMCGCPDCKAGMARRARERRADRKAGTYARGRVDVEETRAKLEWLRGLGLGVAQIERETRVPRIVLQGICWGATDHQGRRYERRTITARYAARILALTPQLHMFADGAKIPSQGTQRRIEALGCLGWTHAAVARYCGLSDRRVSYITHADRVTARLARKIAAAYDELWNTHPSPRTAQEREQVRRTLARAKANRWAPPLAWDDIDNDAAPQQPEPTNTPDVVAIALAVEEGARVKLTRDERREAVRQLHARHLADSAIAQMLGCNEKTVMLDRHALELPPAVDAGRNPIIRGIAA